MSAAATRIAGRTATLTSRGTWSDSGSAGDRRERSRGSACACERPRAFTTLAQRAQSLLDQRAGAVEARLLELLRAVERDPEQAPPPPPGRARGARRGG